MPNRNTRKGGRRALSGLFALLIVAMIATAFIFVGEFAGQYLGFIYNFVNIKARINIFMVNDDAGTEMISLLNAKNGSVKHIEFLGYYTVEGLDEYTQDFINPVEDTLDTAFKKYDFTFSYRDGALKFSAGVPPSIQTEAKNILEGCGVLPGAGENIKIWWPAPASKSISSGFGGRDLENNGVCTCHKGIDISGDGMEVYAAAPGIVDYAGWDSSGGGNIVRIKHFRTFGQGIYYTYYMHLKEIKTEKNVEITTPGTLIGISGNTGNVTGPHLHFELRKDSYTKRDSINPCQLFVDQNGQKMTIVGCDHEPVAACKYVSGMISGKSVRNYDTDVPLPGAKSGNVKGTVVFKQWD